MLGGAMFTIVVLGVAVLAISLCIIMAAVLFESQSVALGVIEKWREAIASRMRLAKAEKTAREASHKVQEAEARARQTVKRAVDAAVTIAQRLIDDDHAVILQTIGSRNHHKLVHRFHELLDFIASQGIAIDKLQRRALFAEIELAFEKAQRVEEERARQAEIKAEMREEARVEREYQQAVREAEQKAKIKRMALEEALRVLGNDYNEQVEQLRRELAEAEARTERTKSMAEQTKVGHVYIISNIGSFGHGIYKVGLTRRLEPLDRVRELGDASVPFSFDVHALISSDDAPALEAAVQRRLNKYRVNRVNLRKEYFRVDLGEIINCFKKEHGQIDYIADPEALEYLETLAIEREMRGEAVTPEDEKSFETSIEPPSLLNPYSS
jgi:hypothetical protein